MTLKTTGTMKQHSFGLVAILLSVFSMEADQPTLGGSSLGASQTSADHGGPRIQFAESIYDFGTADSGATVRHEFVFTNSGNQLLEVTHVRPSCGCTTAGTWDHQVEPGKTGRIPIQFNTRGFGGPVKKTIRVVCNDSAQSNVSLEIKGTVWKPIDVTPTFAIFTPGPDLQTNETRVIRILNKEDKPLALSEPVCTNSVFQARLGTVVPGKEFELHITSIPPFGPGSTSSAITINTSSEKTPVIGVIAIVTVQLPIVVRPPQITVPAGQLVNAAQYTVTIQNNTTNSLTLSEPRVNAEGADVQLKEIVAGRLYSLTTTLPAGFEVQPSRIIAARVKSNLPKFPIINIPVIPKPAASDAPVSSGHETSQARPPNRQAPRVSPALSQLTRTKAPTPLASQSSR